MILVLQDSFFFLNHEILKGNQEDRKEDHSHPYKINGKEMFIHNGKGKKYREGTQNQGDRTDGLSDIGLYDIMLHLLFSG